MGRVFKNAMNRIWLGAVLGAGGAGFVFGASIRYAFAQQPEILRTNLSIGPVAVGGMSPEDAEKALRVWWEQEKLIKLKVRAPGLDIKLPEMRPGALGVTLDDLGSVNEALKSDSGKDRVDPVFKANGLSLKPLEAELSKSVGAGHPAKVRYEKGEIVREPEVPGAVLDEAALPGAVGKALLAGHELDLPLTTGQPKLGEDALKQITDVVASYTTHFSTSKRTRCSNIKLAAHLIDGTVLLPGERFSFNGVVGRRTLKAGFKLAGVYINGQHDTGVGGGICQVSTTLYNAALLSDLAIHRRSNHSLPVPYVPLGRDATVDYGNLDLVFENTYPTPIAVSSEYHPGALTFRILGKKQAGLAVKIIRGPVEWQPAEIERIDDPKLVVGQKRVIKPGSAYRAVTTTRLVYQDGKVIKRERLGRSTYGGKTRIVAVGTGATAVPPTPNSVSPTPSAGLPPASGIRN